MFAKKGGGGDLEPTGGSSGQERNKKTPTEMVRSILF
jgi:hypothetical protein